MSSFQIMKKRKGRVLELYERSDAIVSFLAKQSPLCDKISKSENASIQLIREIGSGIAGSVWEVKIDNQGISKYAVVKLFFDIPENIEEKSRQRETLEEYAKRNERSFGINKLITIDMNGGDPNRIIEIGDILLLPELAKNCLTTETKEFYYNRFDKNSKILVVPEGSYICGEVFSEYLIGLLCAKLYTEGFNQVKSINFTDVFDLSICSKFVDEAVQMVNPTYLFEQQLEGSADQKDSPFGKLKTNEEFGPFMLQILHSIECYQRAFQMNHNDLHLGNIAYGKTPDLWNGENISLADYFEYSIDGISFYIPTSEYVVKIIDFSISAKYDHPMIIEKTIIDIDSQFPIFYSKAYDVGTILMRMIIAVKDKTLMKSEILLLCFHHFMGGFRSEEFQNMLHESNNNLFDIRIIRWLENRFKYKFRSRIDEHPIIGDFFKQGSPKIYMLEKFPLNIMDAASILKSDIFKGYRERPEGRIVRVGTC